MKEVMPITNINLKALNAPLTRRTALGAVFAAGMGATALAQESPRRPREELQEPVFRQATRNDDPKRVKKEPHPLDEAINVAEDALKHFRDNYDDYTALLYKRERVGGVTGDLEVAQVKIRNHKEQAGAVTQSFAVYLKFVKPAKIYGREALWVEGANNGKLCGHKGKGEGMLTMSAWLLPTSHLAMAGQLYPITEIGIENLINKLIERGDKERQFPDVEVSWAKSPINKRPCRVLTLLHEKKDSRFDFHKAQIFIDDEYKVPVRYVAWDWPKGENLANSDILEEYTYADIKFNVGLTDKDFDTRNKAYNF